MTPEFPGQHLNSKHIINELHSTLLQGVKTQGTSRQKSTRKREVSGYEHSKF